MIRTPESKSVRGRALLLFAVLAGPACQCFEPVEESCLGSGCPTTEVGGGGDAGLPDAGHADAGQPDAGSDGGEWACEPWDGGGVGKCAALTGYVFSGNACHGDCVEYPIVTAGVFPTLSACAGQCSAQGFCVTSMIETRPLGGVVGPGSYCDDLVVGTNLARLIVDAFPGVDAGCRPTGAIASECTIWNGALGDAGYARACAATLVPRTQYVECRVYVH